MRAIVWTVAYWLLVLLAMRLSDGGWNMDWTTRSVLVVWYVIPFIFYLMKDVEPG